MAASIATRNLLLRLDAKAREECFPVLAPRMCLNRYCTSVYKYHVTVTVVIGNIDYLPGHCIIVSSFCDIDIFYLCSQVVTSLHNICHTYFLTVLSDELLSSYLLSCICVLFSHSVYTYNFPTVSSPVTIFTRYTSSVSSYLYVVFVFTVTHWSIRHGHTNPPLC